MRACNGWRCGLALVYIMLMALLLPQARGQALITSGGVGKGDHGIYVLQGFPDITNVCQFPVTGIPSSTLTHSVSYADVDHALASAFGGSRVYVISISKAAAIDVIQTTTTKWIGSGTLAVAPAGDYALGCGGSDFAIGNQLCVIKAPFNASSQLTTVGPLLDTNLTSTSIKSFQSQAIAFASNGRAYVYTTNGAFSNPMGCIFVLDPPYTSIAFKMAVPENEGGALAISGDGKTIMTTLANHSTKVCIFKAPFSAASVPLILTIGTQTPALSAVLDPIAITPDGSKALVGEAGAPRLYVINAPFFPESLVEEIKLPDILTIGFEDIEISPDGQNAIVTGNDDGNRERALFLHAPFNAAQIKVEDVDIGVPPSNGRGAGSGRFRRSPVSPALSVYKCAPGVTTPGADLTYEFHVKNNGAVAATSVVLRDTVPGSTTFLGASDGGTLATGIVSWNLGTLSPGVERIVTMTVHVNAGGGTIVNDTYSVQAGASAPIPGPRAITNVQPLTITGSAPKSVLGGANYTYTFHYKNCSTTATFTSVRIYENLPFQVTYVSATGNPSHFFGSPVTWSLPNLAPLAEGDVTLTVQALGGPDKAHNNSYFLRVNEFSTPLYGEALTTDINPLLLIKKYGPPYTMNGARAVYDLIATNNSLTTVTGVSVVDPLPPNTTFISASNGGVFNTNQVTWNLGNMAAGAVRKVQLIVRVTATSGKIINQDYYVTAGAQSGVRGNAVTSTIPRPGAAVREASWSPYD